VGGGTTIRVFNVWEILYLLGVVAAVGFVEVYMVPPSGSIMYDTHMV
jgi:hypothetical protein